MGDYATLKAGITANIKQNDSQLVTGAILQEQLLAMVNELGAGYQFMGVATPSTNPGTPDENVFYLAYVPGTYPNFGDAEVLAGQIKVFLWDGAWSVETIDSASIGDVLKICGKHFYRQNNLTAQTYFPFPYFDGETPFRFLNIGTGKIFLYLRKGHTFVEQIELAIDAGGNIDITPGSEYTDIFFYRTADQSAGAFMVNPISQLEIGLSESTVANTQSIQRIDQAIYLEAYEGVEPIDTMTGKYINGLGDLIEGASAFQILVYNVSGGEVLKIKNTFHLGTAHAYAFYNSDTFSSDSLVSLGPAVSTTEDNFSVIVPEGATHLLLQGYNATEQEVQKKVSATPVNNALLDLAEDVNGNTLEIQRLQAEMKPLAYRFDGENLYIAYNDKNGVEYVYWFKKCMANQLYTFYLVGYRNVDRTVPDTTGIEDELDVVVMNKTYSDNIGPLNMTNGSWVGGNHTWQGGNVLTAKTDTFAIEVDGMILDGAISGYCENICIKVANTIYDPMFEPEEGATILSTPLCSEYVTYIVKKNTIEVALSFKFVSNTTNTIKLYYGMQSVFGGEDYIMTPNGFYTDWTGVDNVDSFTKGDYPHFNRFIEKKSTAPAYQSTFLLNDFGLGTHSEIGNEDMIYLHSGTKNYHKIIAEMASIAGKYLEWGGSYTFFKNAIVDDANVFVYRGVVRGKDALFVNTKGAFSGTIPVPGDMVMRDHSIYECRGIVDAGGGTNFRTGGDGLYISSPASGSLILIFD